MAIRYEHLETVRVTPERAFAAIDDLPLTAKWLPPCVSLEKIGDGPNAPGDKLRYVYKQGGRQSEMSGKIPARTPNARRSHWNRMTTPLTICRPGFRRPVRSPAWDLLQQKSHVSDKQVLQ